MERTEPAPVRQVLVGAVATAAYIAVPDYLESRAGQRAARGAMAVALVAPAAWSLVRSWRAIVEEVAGDEDLDDEDDDDLDDEDDDHDPEAARLRLEELGLPLRRPVIEPVEGALVLASVPLGVVSFRATTRLNHVVAARLASRGVRRPYTWVGLGWGVVRVGRGLAGRRARR